MTQPNQSDLAVCYRIYPRVSGRPIFGFTDKLGLVRLNLESFREAAGNLKLKMWFLLDNCPPAYEELVRTLFPDQKIEIIRLAGEGNGATFRRQVDILASQQDAELVYFAEDDYLYLPGALERGVAFIEANADADFLTLYDHSDHYTKYIHRSCRQWRTSGEHAWRPVASTCLTFMARRTALAETANTFRSFSTGNSDLGLWLALTKKGVLNPWSFVRSFRDGAFVSASHFLAWKYCLGQIVGGKRRHLWAPRPSLATHMESRYLAPGVDWESAFRRRAERRMACET